MKKILIAVASIVLLGVVLVLILGYWILPYMRLRAVEYWADSRRVEIVGHYRGNPFYHLPARNVIVNRDTKIVQIGLVQVTNPWQGVLELTDVLVNCNDKQSFTVSVRRFDPKEKDIYGFDGQILHLAKEIKFEPTEEKSVVYPLIQKACVQFGLVPPFAE